MKFQPAQHDLARPALSEVERANAGAHLAAQDPRRWGVELPSAAGPVNSLWANHVANALSEHIKAHRRPMQGSATARGAGGELGGRLGLRGPPTQIECHQRGTLRRVGKSQIRLIKIDRISAPIVGPHAGGDCTADSIASRQAPWNVAS
ncbi:MULTISPECIES: hypothetical protein [Bradyrhizobium]|uniref:Uncharacterized protein n=1 Tax=Bradyrhizobium elkanii TaxID=29448 RepID=A0A4U6RU57_BRAEL|nr:MULTISPECIES: hypothetical protein [Bradyrhizobium]MTV19087.1 hypothetical protein [Bradyrhizobium sp. BR2003]TKV77851.1 hypothetical protein FDV58_28645 [Bradyrhizobium elkanii]